MAKVGRNAPCPCGSGKKHKHCCLKTQLADQQQRMTVQRSDQELIDRILQFATSEDFYLDSASAAQLYWDTGYAPRLAHLMPPYDRLLFLEWYVFDYRTHRDRKRCTEIFLEEHERQLRPDEIDRLHSFIDSRLGLYQAREVQAEKLELGDLLRDTSAVVNGEQWLRVLKPEDVIIGRLLGTVEYPYLSPRSFLLPPESAEGLRVYAENQLESYREDQIGATLEGFLLDAGYKLPHHLMSEESEKWYDKAGGDTAYYDAGGTRQLLGQLVERMREEDLKAREEKQQEEPVEEEQEPQGEILTPDQIRQLATSQKRQPEREPLPRTASGLILPESMRPQQPAPEQEETAEEAEGEKERPVLYIPSEGY